jgi:hypothetical protein
VLDVVGGPRPLHHLERLVVAPLPEQPARALGQKQQPGEHEHRRHRREPEHPAPRLGVGERVADPVGDEDPDDDQELVGRDDAPALLLRARLGQVERDRRGRRPEREADHEARADQRGRARRDRRRQGTGGEHPRRDQQRAPAPQPVRELAGGERADDRAEEQRRDHGLLAEVAEVEVGA